MRHLAIKNNIKIRCSDPVSGLEPSSDANANAAN